MSGDDLGACIRAVVDMMGNHIRKPLIIPRGDTRPDFDVVVVQPQQIIAVAQILGQCGSARTSSRRSENP